MPDTSKPIIARGLITVGIFGAVLLAAILAGAYYQEDLSTYVQLRGWSRSSAEQFVRDFIDKTVKKSPDAAAMLDDRLVKSTKGKGGELTAVMISGPSGPIRVPVERIMPTADIKETTSRIRYKAKKLEVSVQYANGKWAVFQVTRPAGEAKIGGCPGSVSDKQPVPELGDE